MRAGIRLGSDMLSKKDTRNRRLAKAFQYADEDPDTRIIGYFTWLQRSLVRAMFVKELQTELDQFDPMEPLQEALRSLPSKTPPINRMLYLDSRFFLTDHNLNYTDKMSMAAGVEVRVPYLDPDLMRFAATLPPNLKQHGRIGKWIFKSSMERYLPNDVIYRKKTGFGVPLRSWLQNELREHARDMLSESSLSRRGMFDPIGVAKLIDDDRVGKIDAAYPIFGLMCIEKWCRIFVDGDGSAAAVPG
jgi:asparagine synthase (glutamine-hydrolysing)